MTGQVLNNAHSYVQLEAPTPIKANMTGQVLNNAHSYMQTGAKTKRILTVYWILTLIYLSKEINKANPNF